jgi:uncharacterized protein
MTRRQWITRLASGLALGGTAAAAYTWLVEPHWVDFARRRLPIVGLPRDLEGRLLVQLSDIHVGPRVDDHYLIDTFARVSRMAPTIVAITGDFVSYRAPAHLDQLRRVIAHVPRGRLGTVGILGNHDYGRNWAQLEVADAVSRILGEAGITILRNEVTEGAGLQIVGMDDLWSPRFAPREALARREARDATIVLCHNPDGVDARPGDADPWAGYAGWILAGHTHGGQCKPPFLPPPLLPVRNRRYTSGEIALSGGRRLYINRGLGHLIRVRFNVRPEVTLFELRRA